MRTIAELNLLLRVRVELPEGFRLAVPMLKEMLILSPSGQEREL
jgi:hypothetical protein